MKNKLVACLLVLCLALSFVACDLSTLTNTDTESGNDAGAYAYIAIDINPSLELIVADGKVESVRACNDDASVLLSDEDLSGLTPEEATEKIVALAEELGYLNEDNTDVKITVSAEEGEDTAELEEKVKDGAKKGSSLAIVNSNPRLADEREVKALKEENPELYKNFNPAKLRLIKSIMEYDPEMTIEIGVEMEMSELIKLLDSYAKEYKGIVGDELKEKFNERKKELKLERERQIAEIYGDEHLEAWSKHEELKDLYKELEKKAENAELSEEDINAIIAIIGEENGEFIKNDDGVVTVKSVFEYLDTLAKEHLDEIRGQVEAILDAYREKDYPLSNEDRAKIEEAVGEMENEFPTRLEDFDKFIERIGEDLDKMKDETELDDSQKQAIGEIKEGFNTANKELNEEFKSEMESAHEFFKKQKADRLR
ncbi:MAG: hypothetical protein IJZ04_04075 [Clostridia bacterium]|nr:hypothetical protein [Clostridia bacterium]